MTIKEATKIKKGDMVHLGDDIYRKVLEVLKGHYKGLYRVKSPVSISFVVKASQIKKAYRPI